MSTTVGPTTGEVPAVVAPVGPAPLDAGFRAGVGVAGVEPERGFRVLRDAGDSVPAWPLSDRFPVWLLDVGAVLERAYGEWYAERCAFVAQEHGRPRRLDGGASTSRGPAFGDLDVHTVVLSSGTVVEQHLPWLVSLYRGAFLRLANELVGPLTGQRYVTSSDRVSAVNLNLLEPGERYEWHVDSNPLTGLLFCPTGDEGSELVFSAPVEADDQWTLPVRARWGHMLLFDARAVPHCVRGVTAPRVSVPMNFHVHADRPERPPDIDRYLYG
ncbi:MAG TPA: hypothetical protein VF743_02145 [Acidimicrobiales bacterium]